MTEMGHLRPGPISSRPANVSYASDRYRNDEPLNPTFRAISDGNQSVFLDHLVGANERRRWNGDPEFFGSLEVNDKLQFGW